MGISDRNFAIILWEQVGIITPLNSFSMIDRMKLKRQWSSSRSTQIKIAAIIESTEIYKRGKRKRWGHSLSAPRGELRT